MLRFTDRYANNYNQKYNVYFVQFDKQTDNLSLKMVLM